MKRLRRVFALLTLVLCICIGFSACSDFFAAAPGGSGATGNTDGEQVSEAMIMYREAVEEGYDGTYLEFIENYRTRQNSVSAGGVNTEITVNDDGLNPGADLAALSVVKIATEFVYASVYGNKTVNVSGAGVIYVSDEVSHDMYVLTNYHVVYDVKSSLNANPGHISNNISVWLFGGETESCKLSATYFGGAMDRDVAVLFIDGDTVVTESGGATHTNASVIEGSAARPITPGDSDKISIGDRVFAIGNPNGKGISATQGIVSVKCENVELTALNGGSRTVESAEIRVDAAINHGNSGGGLFNSRGEFVGTVNARNEEDGVRDFGYAIPSNLVLAVARNVIETRTGGARRADLGIATETLSSHSVYNGKSGVADSEETISVKSVSGAAADILKIGDIINSVTLKDKKTGITHEYQLTVCAYDLREGDTLEYGISRDGQDMNLSVTYDSSCFVYES